MFELNSMSKGCTVSQRNLIGIRYTKNRPQIQSMALVWGLSILWVAGTNCSRLPQIHGEPLSIRGAVVAHVHSHGLGYGSGQSKRLYQKFKDLGINYIQLNTFAGQRNTKSTSLLDDDATLTLDHLRQEIRDAHQAGFQILLKPHIWIMDRYKSKDQWRSNIRFKNAPQRRQWFESYAQFYKGQIDVAIQENVAMVAVGTELVGMSRHEHDWRRFIALIRMWGFRGKLTYAAEAWNAPNIKFWDALDYIGLDVYFKNPQADPNKPQAIIDFYAQKIKDVQRLSTRLQRPVLFTELGFPAHGQALKTPHAWPAPGTQPRPELQRLGFQLFREGLAQAGYAPNGIFIWKYVTTLDSYERHVWPTGFIVEGKSAEMEIGHFFKNPSQ